MYMEGTQFEMKYFNGPDEMHRVALSLMIGLTWHSEGDPVKDPGSYTESFDVIDSCHPENNRTGISRKECEVLIYNEYCNEINQ